MSKVRSELPEVIGIIPHETIIRWKGYSFPPGPIEVREHKNGTFSVWYLDEGFVACAKNCNEQLADKKHKCATVQPYVESYFGKRGINAPEPDKGRDSAVEYARYLAGPNREVKVLYQSGEVEILGD